MSETSTAISCPAKPKPRWMKITVQLLLAVFVLWLAFVGYMWNIMHRPPEAFARVMMHLPWEVFLVCPFETMWTHARAGAIKVGDPAPDFSLMNVDKNSRVRLSELNKTQPVVMIFGSYT